MATKTVAKRTEKTVISGNDLASEITRKRYVTRTVDQWHALFNKKYRDNHTPESKDGQQHKWANIVPEVIALLSFVAIIFCAIKLILVEEGADSISSYIRWFVLGMTWAPPLLFSLQWAQHRDKHSDMHVKSTDCAAVNPMKKWHHPISLYQRISKHSFDTDNYVWKLFGEYNDLFVSYVELKEPSQHTAPVYIQAMESKEKEIQSIIDDYEEYLLDEDKQRAELLKSTLGVQELSS